MQEGGRQRTDARANITSHRAPALTRHYPNISPTRLAKSYTDAGYFARNLRAIDVGVQSALEPKTGFSNS